MITLGSRLRLHNRLEQQRHELLPLAPTICTRLGQFDRRDLGNDLERKETSFTWPYDGGEFARVQVEEGA